MTGVLMAAVGVAVVFGATKTSFVHEVSLIPIAVASVVAGLRASRANAQARDPKSPDRVVASAAVGIVTGIAVILVLGAVAMVVAVISFEHSNFVW
jgi:hypothetical protein